MAREKCHTATGDSKLTADIRVYLHPELKELVWDAAEKDDVPLSEFVARVLADRMQRPDLRAIPRSAPGRKRHKENGNGHAKTNGHHRKNGK